MNDSIIIDNTVPRSMAHQMLARQFRAIRFGLIAFGVMAMGLSRCNLNVAFGQDVGESESASIEPPSVGALNIHATKLLTRHAELSRVDQTHSHRFDSGRSIEPIIHLFVLLRSDQRYESSPRLRGIANRVRRRLMSVADDEANRLKRAGIEQPSWPDLRDRIAAEIRDLKSSEDELGGNHLSDSIRSRIDGGGKNSGGTRRDFRGGGSGDVRGGGSGDSRDADSGGGRAAGNAAGGGTNDGWELVMLIRQIIRPDFWQNAGGNGVVHYLATRRVLVVRATTDVHQDIKDLLTALR